MQIFLVCSFINVRQVKRFNKTVAMRLLLLTKTAHAYTPRTTHQRSTSFVKSSSPYASKEAAAFMVPPRLNNFANERSISSKPLCPVAFVHSPREGVTHGSQCSCVCSSNCTHQQEKLQHQKRVHTRCVFLLQFSFLMLHVQFLMQNCRFCAGTASFQHVGSSLRNLCSFYS